jgi:sirohydrochlorin cobaltochelatase
MSASNQKKAILIVSFGTTHNRTREKNINSLENDMRSLYPDYTFYYAWTSKMIIKKIKDRDHKEIPTVSKAMENIVKDGITELIVQPTHIINGVENDFMKEDVLKFKDSFKKISFGAPLLNDTEDAKEVINILADEYLKSDKDSALVLMGHGSSHYSNFAYAALDYTFKEMGYENVIVGTIEAYPDIDIVLRSVNKIKPSKVILAPFMLVAGDHAVNDMSGDDEDSWKSIFEKAGYHVTCHIKGLGEYKRIRDIYLNHLKAAI